MTRRIRSAWEAWRLFRREPGFDYSSPASLLVGIAGVALYGAAAFGPLAVSGRFWTARTLGEEVPWYYMGQAFVSGVWATGGLVLCGALGSVASRRFGGEIWNSLIPAFLFLSMPFGRGVGVLLHTSRIWEGPSRATSAWRTFDEYLFGVEVSGHVALAVVCGVIVLSRWRAHREIPTTSELP